VLGAVQTLVQLLQIFAYMCLVGRALTATSNFNNFKDVSYKYGREKTCQQLRWARHEREQLWYCSNWKSRFYSNMWMNRDLRSLQFYFQKLGFDPVFLATGRLWERKCNNSYC